MKKYFSLVVFLFCFVGSVWGQVTVTSTSISCYGMTDGTVTVNINPSQTGPFDVRLYQGFTYKSKTTSDYTTTFDQLAPGAYTVRVFKSGTTTPVGTQQPITVDDVKEFKLAEGGLTVKNGTCRTKGYIEAIVNGGTRNYTFTLTSIGGYSETQVSAAGSALFNNLDADTYSLTITDAHGCGPLQYDNLEITTPPQVSGQILSIENVLCKGEATGSVSVKAIGGSAPYLFVLDGEIDFDEDMDGIGDFMGLSDRKDYFVTIIDGANCEYDIPFEITEPNTKVAASITSFENVTGCPGDNNGTISIAAQNGTPGYTYSINNGSSFEGSGNSYTFSSLFAGTYHVVVKDANGCKTDPIEQVITEPKPISFTAELTTPVECKGDGNAVITITYNSGGTGTIQYQLEQGGTIIQSFQTDPTFSGVSAGTYTIRAKDEKGCEIVSDPVVIDDPEVITVSGIPTGAECFDDFSGKITVSGSGRGDTYAYEYNLDGGTWQTGNEFPGLKGGQTYTILAKAGNCVSDPVEVTVDQPTELTASVTGTTKPTCSTTANPDGTITVSADGGTAPYTYSNGVTTSAPTTEKTYTFTGLGTGTYTITVTDVNGCSAPAIPPVIIDAPADVQIVSVMQNPDQILCFGGTAVLTITVSGEQGRGFQYRVNSTDNTWTAFSGSQFTLSVGLGTYFIEVKYVDPWSTCQIASQTVTVDAPDLLDFTTSYVPITCTDEKDGEIIVNAAGGSYTTYIYSIAGPNTSISDVTDGSSHTFTGLGAGLYTITVKDSNGCETVVSKQVDLKNPTPISITKTEHTDVTCPSGDNDGSITVGATGGTGTLTYSINYSGAEQLIDGVFTKLPKGNYIVTITDSKGCEETTESITIGQPGEIEFAAEAQPKILTCDGATADIIVTVTSPATGSFVYRLQGYTAGWQSYNNSGTNKITGVDKGIHIVEMTYTGGTNCPNIATRTVTIEPIPITFTLSGIKNNCPGDENASITIENPSITTGVKYMLEKFDGNNFIIIVSYGDQLSFTGLEGGIYKVTAKVEADDCTVSEGVDLSDPLPAQITNVQKEDLTCFEDNTGKIIVAATGDNTPLKYEISPVAGTNHNDGTFTGLPADTYTITVTDAKNCIPVATTEVIIAQPDKLEATFKPEDIVNVSCNGKNNGSATVTVTGGKPDYTYTWPNGVIASGATATNLAPGSYTVEITDATGTCSTTATVVITEPAELTLTFNSSDAANISCNGEQDGSIRVTVAGGTPDYIYTINGVEASSSNMVIGANGVVDFTNLTQGTYTIVVTDKNGCTAKAENILIEEPEPITGSIDVTSVSCTDYQLTANASGGVVSGQPVSYTYLWNTTETTQTITGPAGNYSVIVTVRGTNCKETFTKEITAPAALDVIPTAIDVTCNGLNNGSISLEVTGGTPDYTYVWTKDGSNYPSATKDISNLEPGDYSVKVTDDHGCFVDLGPITISEPDQITNIDVQYDAVACGNQTTTLTVTADGSQKLAYSLDGTTWQESNTFQVKAGNHTIYVGYWVSDTEAAKCYVTKAFNIPGRAAITIDNVDYKAVLECNETSTTVTITATGEGNPSDLRYNMEGTWVASNVFTLPAGSYIASVQYADEPHCPETYPDPVVITKNINIIISDVEVIGDMDCSDSEVSIVITASGPDGALEYSIGNGFETTNRFDNLPAGNYPISVRYQGGTCAQEWGIKTITAPKAIVPESPVIGQNPLNCADEYTTVTVNASGQAGRTIEYSIDNGTNWYPAGSMINNVPAGTYTIIARYKSPDPACQVEGETFKITAPAAIDIKDAYALKNPLDCFDETTEIHIDAVGENGYTLEYSIEGGVDGSWQTNNPVFVGVKARAASYQVVVRYQGPNGCQVTGPAITVSAPAEIKVTSFTPGTTGKLECFGDGSTTTLTVIATGGANMEYVISNGSQTWTSDNGVFEGMGVGTYTACVRYKNNPGCQTCYPDPVILQSNSPITIVTLAAVDGKLNCDETSTKLTVTVDPPSDDYEYNLNGGSGWMTKAEFENLDVFGGTYSVLVHDKNDPSCEQASNMVTVSQPQPVTILSVTENEAACYDGKSSVTVVATNDQSDIMTYTLTPVGGGTTYTNNSGTFPDVEDGTYTVRVAYQDADYSACYKEWTQPITLAKPAKIEILSVSADETELKCADATTNLTVVASGNRDLEFSLDGNNWFSNADGSDTYIFTNVGEGTYTAKVRYRTSNPAKCMVEAEADKIVIVKAWKLVQLTVDPEKTMLECDETSVNVEVTATGEANKAIDFSVDGITWVTSVNGKYTFVLGAKSYQISARYHDNTGCFVSQSLTINQNIDINIDQVNVTPSRDLTCFEDKATITISATGNGSDLEYTIDGVTWKDTYQFPDLGKGDYIIGVRYKGQTCVKWYNGNPIKITAPDEIKINSVEISGIKTNHADMACPEDRAVITIYASGSQAMEYSIDNGDTWQDDKIFQDVNNGSYLIKVRYKVGAKCEVPYGQQVTVFVPVALQITSVNYIPDLDCADSKTDITINVTGEQTSGYGEWEYTLDGDDVNANWQSSKTFSGMGAGTYKPRVRYAKHTGCAAASAADFTITAPQPIVINSINPVIPSLDCDGTTTAINLDDITYDPGRTIEYSLDKINWYDKTNLPEVGVGAYTVYVRYAAPYAACMVQKSGSVLSNSTIQGVTITSDKATYGCGDYAILTVNVSSSDPGKTLQYRINGGAWQQHPNNTFKVTITGTWVAEVSYTDDITCIQSSDPLEVIIPTPITISKVETDYGKTVLDCYNDKTHITVYADGNGELLKYTLMKDGAEYDTKIGTHVFHVGAGTYEVKVSYDNGSCETSYSQPIVITEPAAIEIDGVQSSGDIQCEGEQATLTVKMKSSQAGRSLEYSADGTNWQPTNQLLVDPGTYNVQVRYKQPDYPACAVPYINNPVTVKAPDIITISRVDVDKLIVDCDDITDKATIDVIATSSDNTRSLEYSFDGGNSWGNQSLQAVGAGAHTVMVRFADTHSCPKSDVVIIQSNAGIQFSNVTVSTPITCANGTGAISVTIVSAAANLQLSINGEPWIDGIVSGTPYLFENRPAGTYIIMARSSDKENCIVTSTPPIELKAPKPVTASIINQVNASGCYSYNETSGSVTISIADGTAPYQYQLDGTGNWIDATKDPLEIDNLKSGNHIILIRDKNECEPPASVSVDITNPDVINIDPQPKDIRCFGEANGQLTIRVTQGHAPFQVTVTAPQVAGQNGQTSPAYSETFHLDSYSDFRILTGLYANYYTITVTDANQCEANVTVRIRQPQGPLIADFQGQNICPGEQFGSIIPKISGGTGASYASYWYVEKTEGLEDYVPMFPDASGNAIKGEGPPIDEIKKGRYAIVVEDKALCRDTSYVEIINLEAMEVDKYVSHGVVCQNAKSGSIEIINPQGGAGGYYEFSVHYQGSGAVVPGFDFAQWPNNIIAGLEKGDYYVEMRDHQGAGCPSLRIPENKTEYITIGSEDGISIDKITVTGVKCHDDENDQNITDIRVSGTSNTLEYKLKYPDTSESAWQSKPVFNNLPDGTYTVYVQEAAGGNGCSTSKDTTIAKPAQLLITASVIEAKCDANPVPGQVTITVTGGTGQPAVTYNGTTLTNGVQGDIATNEWTFTQTIVKGGKAVIEAIDENECTAETTVDIPYTAGLEFDEPTIVLNECPNDRSASITILARSVNSTPGSITYELYQGEATIPANRVDKITMTNIATPVVFKNLANGTYTISAYDDKNPQACYTEDLVKEITNTNTVELIDAGVSNNTCLGKKDGYIEFTIKGDPSNTSYKYTINGYDERTVTASGGVAYVFIGESLEENTHGLIAGEYEITIYYGRCEYSQIFTIEDEIIVDPTITADPVTGCYGDATGAINIQMPDKKGVPYEYWYSVMNNGDFQKFTPSTSDKATISGLRGGDYQVIVRQKDQCMSEIRTITVPNAPRMSISYTETTPISCKGNYGTVSITIDGGSGNYTTSVVPQEEGGYPDYARAPALNGLILSDVTGGLYRIAVVDNGTGCKDTLNVNINAPVSVEITTSHVDPCDPGNTTGAASILITITKPASGTFEYYFNGVLVAETSQTSYTQSAGPGVYEIWVKDKNDGCLADAEVVINEQPAIEKINEELIPISDQCEFEVNLTVVAKDGTQPYTYSMDGGPFQNSPQFMNVSEGSHTFIVKDANENVSGGCNSLPMIFVVSAPQPIAVTANIHDVTCNKDGKGTIVLTANTQPDTYTYLWADGVTGNARYELDAGDYPVTIVNAAGNCSAKNTYTVKAANEVLPKLEIIGNVNPAAICPGTIFEVKGLLSSSNMDNTTAVWLLPDAVPETFDAATPVKSIGAVTGKIQLAAQLYVESAKVYCRDTATIVVSTYAVPTITMAADTIFIPKDEIYVLKTDVAGDYQPGSVIWTAKPDYGYHDYGQTISPVEISSPEQGSPYTLKLTITNEIGCKVSDSIYVSRAMDFFIPNAFTPNDDGVHDTWMFRNIEQYMDYYDIQVAVFNRGGFQVYEGKGYNNSSVVFDGRRNGNDLPIGTYYYVVKLVPKSTTGSSETHTFTGSVTIVR